MRGGGSGLRNRIRGLKETRSLQESLFIAVTGWGVAKRGEREKEGRAAEKALTQYWEATEASGRGRRVALGE